MRKLCRSVAAASDAASAAAVSCHSVRSTSGVRYSAPGIIGAVSTRDASSAVGECRCFRGWLQAQRGHVARRESAPPQEDRRQRLAHLAGTEPQQPLAAAARERLGQPRGDARVQFRRVGGVLEDQVRVWRET